MNLNFDNIKIGDIGFISPSDLIVDFKRNAWIKANVEFSKTANELNPISMIFTPEGFYVDITAVVTYKNKYGDGWKWILFYDIEHIKEHAVSVKTICYDSNVRIQINKNKIDIVDISDGTTADLLNFNLTKNTSDKVPSEYTVSLDDVENLDGNIYNILETEIDNHIVKNDLNYDEIYEMLDNLENQYKDIIEDYKTPDDVKKIYKIFLNYIKQRKEGL